MTGLRVGLALSTIGRATLPALLDSVATAHHLPVAVAVADHTRQGDLRVPGDYPFPVTIVHSTGGASRGRNDAAVALGRDIDVLGFPNDDNTYTSTTLSEVVRAFAAEPAPDAVAGTLLEDAGPRFVLPRAGTLLDRRTVWRAIEPAVFLRRVAFERAGGFRDDLGSGAASPWQSGDGTDLLLKVLGAGGHVLSAPGVEVVGRGERKGLSEQAWVDKHRAYARGTGYVYRDHGYPWSSRLRVLVAPLLKPTSHDPSLHLSLRLAYARSAGRLEGLIGRPLPRSREPGWL